MFSASAVPHRDGSTATHQKQQGSRIQAIAWDPKSPALLILSSTSNEGGQFRFQMNPYLANAGTGSSSYETSALLKILEIENENDGHRPDVDVIERTRQGLFQCLEEWETAKDTTTTTTTTTTGGGNDDDDDSDSTKIELCKIIHTILHLSQIFLLNNSNNKNKDNSPVSAGSATAQMVRHLRFCHMDDLTSRVVRFLDGHSLHPEENAEYWILLEELFVRGCLDDAWALLSHHTICLPFLAAPDQQQQQQQQQQSVVSRTLRMDYEALSKLKAILLSAPLPGGRNDTRDNCSGSSAAAAAVDDETTAAEESADVTIFLQGVNRNDFELWEPMRVGPGGIPSTYQYHTASTARNTWLRHVRETDFTYLLRRLPQLSGCLALLKGDLSETAFASWADAFCAELIYARPHLHPFDMSRRLQNLMEQFGALEGLGEVLLDIMKGNSGRAVEALHGLGGGSGAALPATLTFLLCDQLHKANALNDNDSIRDVLLLSASEAILASHVDKRDIGVRLATLLLVPHVKPSGNEQISEALGDTLERHWPVTDAEAKILLDLTKPVVAKKNIVVLDGCSSLILARYKAYLQDNNFAGAFLWLLRGLELDRTMFGSDWDTLLASGTFCRLIMTMCLDVSKNLLEDIMVVVRESAVETSSRNYIMATEIKESLSHDDMRDAAQEIQEVASLLHVLGIADAIKKNGQDMYSGIAKGVVACLGDVYHSDGTVLPQCHPCFRKPLFEIALKILSLDEDRFQQGKGADFQAYFDQKGMEVLSVSYMKLKVNNDEVFQDERVHEALTHGLKRAFITENAKRKHLRRPPTRKELSVPLSKAYTLRRGDQDRLISKALGDLY